MNEHEPNPRKIAYTIAALFVVCSIPPGVGCAVETGEAGPIHWRVIWKTDPATTATVSWDTLAANGSHRVLLREDGHQEPRILECQRNGAYSGSNSTLPLHYHHARLTELKPATRYFVTLESNGKRSAEMHFVTAPVDEQPFAILSGGDSRSDAKARQAMNALMTRLVAEQSRSGRPDILALAHGGDFIADGRRIEQWNQWLSDHQRTVGANGRLLPIIPTRGNHDVGRIFNEVFDFPARDRNYFAMSFGQQLRWITLNTETSTAGDQQGWLAAELAQSRPTHRWLAVQYHKPAFPAVKVPSGAYPSWVPLFEQHNVDLVCESDGHCIKRTPPLRGNKIDATGVVYVGEGGLGVGQRTPKTGRWYLNSPRAKTGSGHHVQLLTFAADRLTYRVILISGEVFDEHVLTPRTESVVQGDR